MTEQTPIRAIIPAAGKGSRLHCSDIPKAMHLLLGQPLLEIVLENTGFIAPENTYIVVGYKKEKITEYFGDRYRYVVQNEQLGTGHAVHICAGEFSDFDGTVLVTFGDMPFFRREVLTEVCKVRAESGAGCTLLTAFDPAEKDWAKIVRDQNGDFTAIVEGRDLTEEQNRTGELFAGVLAFDSKALFRILPKLGRGNAQGEYYLTEVPGLMRQEGLLVNMVKTDDLNDLCGVNTPEDLERCEQVMKARKKGC